MGWVGGWSETDNRAISVQLNLTGTATGTELGKNVFVTSQHYVHLCGGAFFYISIKTDGKMDRQ